MLSAREFTCKHYQIYIYIYIYNIYNIIYSRAWYESLLKVHFMHIIIIVHCFGICSLYTSEIHFCFTVGLTNCNNAKYGQT